MTSETLHPFIVLKSDPAGMPASRSCAGWWTVPSRHRSGLTPNSGNARDCAQRQRRRAHVQAGR